ncbi:glucosaminidase domain-containing protein [Mucilaginibacter sp. RS28]|uniref:Glucosaminidase domain-containing protein n=1 Tax=Mucilaginibacter straminoryzae TaxID=2932774 RepID=A0A9X1X447_9SPHI|nr:glucosaminidase domain-containing protein [Mucilaginibacter straminoryzae]MCJ8210623.1 glucosaminidase domain-containing protein [Mucilaginibacter straminoryzae]
MKKILLIVSFLATASIASAQNASQSYIQRFKDNAIRIMHESGVPASIVLAIAMHESGSGTSKLARTQNNHFGMKGKSAVSYTGRKATHSSYKQYDSAQDSFQDFARVMTERKKFTKLAETLSHYDYLGWVKGIQHSGYASSRKWGAQVLGLIRKYNLSAFDERPDTTRNQAQPKNVE